MRQTLAVAANDLRLIFSDGSAWINILVVPIVLALVIGYSVNLISGGGADEPIRILDIVDRDQSALSSELIVGIARANPDLVLCIASPSATPDPVCETGGAVLLADSLPDRLDDDISTAWLDIPAGFAESISEPESDPLPLVYRSNESVTSPSVTFAAVEAAASGAGAGLQAQRVAEHLIAALEIPAPALSPVFLEQVRAHAQDRLAASPFALEVESASTRAATSESVNEGFAQSIPGMGSMYAVIATLAMVAAWVRDTKQGVVQRARTMAVGNTQLMGGKMLAYFTIGMLQLSILFALGYVLGLRYGTNPAALIALMVTFTFAVTGLALLVTSLVTTDAQAQSIALMLGLIMGPLGGAWWSLQIVPAWMATLGHITPIAWAMDGYRALIYRDAGWSGVALPIAVLAGMATLFFLLGAWRMQRRES